MTHDNIGNDGGQHGGTGPLSDAIDEYLVARRSGGYSKNTVRDDAFNLREMLALIGNIKVRNVTDRHVDSFMAASAARDLSSSTTNMRLATLRGLFRHYVKRRYISAGSDPVPTGASTGSRTGPRLRIPVIDFDRMLSVSKDPRDRVAIALGLHLLLSESEIRLLTIGDVDLASTTVAV